MHTALVTTRRTSYLQTLLPHRYSSPHDRGPSSCLALDLNSLESCSSSCSGSTTLPHQSYSGTCARAPAICLPSPPMQPTLPAYVIVCFNCQLSLVRSPRLHVSAAALSGDGEALIPPDCIPHTGRNHLSPTEIFLRRGLLHSLSPRP